MVIYCSNQRKLIQTTNLFLLDQVPSPHHPEWARLWLPSDPAHWVQPLWVTLTPGCATRTDLGKHSLGCPDVAPLAFHLEGAARINRSPANMPRSEWLGDS